MVYKMINGLVDMDMNYYFTVNENHARSNGTRVAIQGIINDWNTVVYPTM